MEGRGYDPYMVGEVPLEAYYPVVCGQNKGARGGRSDTEEAAPASNGIKLSGSQTDKPARGVESPPCI